jgi:hypothetical protein
MNCFCNDDKRTKDFSCVICNKIENRLMNKVERVWECHKIILMGCGMLEFVCNDCKRLGWYSTAGFGGPTEHINRITGERRSIKIVKDDIF